MPPKLENEEANENWKKDINIWCELTDIDAEKRALAIHLSLTGRARVASSEIGIEDLKKKDGVNVLIKKLDSLFLADQGCRQFTAFHELYNFRRSVDAKVDTFVTEFEHVYYKFRQQDMTLPDTVMAFMLLAASNLTESERQLVMSAITSVSYENMKSALERIFCGSITPSQISNTASVQVKTEPVLYENDDNAAITVGNIQAGVLHVVIS